MILAIPDGVIVGSVVTALVGAIVAAYIALRKSGPEIAGLTIQVAKNVRLVQDEVIEAMQRQMDRVEKENESLRSKVDALYELQNKVRDLEGLLEIKTSEITTLQSRVKHLEEENKRLREEVRNGF